MPFEFHPLGFAGVRVIVPRVFADSRGHFMETFQSVAFAEAGIPTPFIQDNLSSSRRGVLRGLHFQKAPHSQAKLIQVLSGEIYDVVADLRPESPHYGKWAGIRLAGDEPKLLYVPEGLAHGFQVLSEKADVLYKTSQIYHPESEGGVAWNDPDLAISWPIPAPLLSPKDAALPFLKKQP